MGFLLRGIANSSQSNVRYDDYITCSLGIVSNPAAATTAFLLDSWN
jgi:hypothetical protein